MIKRLTYIILPLLVACSAPAEESTQVESGGVGSVAISVEAESNIAVIARSEGYTISSELLPTESDLILTVTNSDGEQMFSQGYDSATGQNAVEIFNSCDQMEDYAGNVITCPLLLKGGVTGSPEIYTFEINDGNDLDVESATNACFAATKQVEVLARDYRDESDPEHFVLTLQNSIIRIFATDDFRRYFENGAEMTITTTAGTVLTYTYDGVDQSGESEIMFVQAGTTLTLGGWAVKQNTTEDENSATKVTFTSCAVGTAEMGRMNTIIIDADGVGTADVTITVSGITVENEEEFDLSLERE
ncbi:MAG: hypothetical protein SNG35_08870 [Rikenellaceae bacterium]